MFTVRRRITGPGILAAIFSEAPSCGWMRITSTLGVNSWTAVFANGRCGGFLNWIAISEAPLGNRLPVRKKNGGAAPRQLSVLKGTAPKGSGGEGRGNIQPCPDPRARLAAA